MTDNEYPGEIEREVYDSAYDRELDYWRQVRRAEKARESGALTIDSSHRLLLAAFKREMASRQYK